MSIENKVQESRITTTQLRLLLSNAAVVKNRVEMEMFKSGTDQLSEKIQNDIKYLLIKHIYQCGREDNVKRFDKDFEISTQIKNIGNSRKKFDEFYRYLEEIVAYTKYYKGK